jgi:PAS domain S-box-containing protein
MPPSTIQVLIVDDDPDLCLLTKEFLGSSGDMELDTVFSVKGARNALAKKHYDAIISDYQMPEEDGIQFLKSLRSKGDKTPFILLTGKGREEVVIEALNNGADSYIQKGGQPVPQYAELEHRVRMAVGKHWVEEEMGRTLSLLESTMESTADGILVTDRQGNIVRSNQIFIRMWGIPQAIIISQDENSALDFVMGKLRDPETFMRIVREIYSSPDKVSFDEIELKDGRVFERYSQPQWVDDCVSGRVWSFRDVTERKRATHSMKQSVAAMENSIDGIAILDVNGKYVFLNQAHAKIYGYDSPEELIGKSWRTLYDETVVDDFEKHHMPMLYATGSWRGESVGLRRDGSKFIQEVSLTIFEEGGLICIVRDISEMARNKEALRQKTAMFEGQVSASIDGILVIDENLRRLLINRRIVELFDVPQYILDDENDQLLLDHVASLTKYPDQFIEKVIYLNEHRNETSRDEIEFKNGMILDRYSAPVLGQDGTFYGRTWTFRDITESKQAEEALRESERKAREIFNNVNDALQVYEWTEEGLPGRFIDVNEVSCRMHGYTREEMLQLGPFDVSTEYHDPPMKEVLESLRTIGSAKFETELRRKDGKVIPIEVHAHNLITKGSKITIAAVRDITEIKRNTSALKNANEKLNLLSSITRHDINNQLIALTGYLTLMENQMDGGRSNDYLRKAEAAAEHISTIIQFTKAYEDIGVRVPIWQKVRSLVEQCSRESHHGRATIVNDIPEDIEMFADPLIINVFSNLIENAIRHGGNTSTVHFSIKERNGNSVIVCEDDGVGIAAEMKGKLFTKGFGKVHGFGLFLSREILAITGISISEDGRPGNGARFVIAPSSGGLRKNHLE